MRINKARALIIDKLFHGIFYFRSVGFNIFRAWLLTIRSEKVGKGLRVDKDCLFYHTNGLIIGNNVWIGRRAFISARGGLTIGNDVLIAFDSVVITEHHIYDKKNPIRKTGFSTKSVKIGNNVLIGAKAFIMPGVTIGNNVVIGAGSIVTNDIPSNTVAAGAPAKIVRKL